MSHFLVNIKAVIDNEMTIIEINLDIASLLGYSQDEFIQDKLLFKEIIHPEDMDIYENLLILKESEDLSIFRVRLIHRNKNIIITRMSCYKRYDEKLEDTLLYISLEDATSFSDSITSQSNIKFFDAMMEKTDDYIFFKSRDHLFTAASETLVSLTNEQTSKGLIGKT